MTVRWLSARGAYQLFVRVLVLLCEDHHGIGGADALVAAAAIAHHGYHRATHARVAGQGRLGDDVGVDGVAEDAVAHRTHDGLAEAVAVVALERLFGSVDVQALGLTDEVQFLQRRLGGKLPYHLHRQLRSLRALLAGCGHSLVKQHLAVTLLMCEVGVGVHDDGLCTVVASRDLYLNVEFVAALVLQADRDVAALDVLLAFGQRLRGEVFDDLQFVLRLANDGTEGYGDGQSDHARAGNAHSHGVFSAYCPRAIR